MADTIGLGIDLDMSDVAKALAQLPEMTGESAEKAVVKFTKSFDRLYRTQKALVRQSDREAQKAAAAQERALKGVYELAGGSGDRLDKLGAILGSLSNPLVAVGAGFLALGAAAAGIGALVSQTEELSRGLEPFKEIEGFEGISDDAMSSVMATNDALGSLVATGKAFVVIAGANLAPVAEKVSFQMVKLGLVALDVWEKFANGKSILESFAEFMVGRLVRAMLTPINALVTVARGLAFIAEAAGADGVAGKLNEAIAAYDGLVDTVSSTVVGGAFEVAAIGAEALGAATGDYDDRTRAIMGTVRELTDEEQRGAEAARDRADAERDEAAATRALQTATEQLSAITERATVAQLDAVAKIEHARDQELAKIAELAQAHPELAQAAADARVAVETQAQEQIREIRARELEEYQAAEDAKTAKARERAEEELRAAQQTLDMHASTYGAMAGAVEDFTQIVIDNAESRGAAGKDAAMAAFALQKTAGISSALISGSVAAIAALTPPPIGFGPGPLGIAQAVAVGATTAGTVAKIASTPAPAFDIGGMIGSGGLIGSRTPDQVLIRALPGERVQSREEVDRGGSMPQTITIVQRYGHRTFDAVASDVIENPGSSLYRSVNGSSRSGHRRSS